MERWLKPANDNDPVDFVILEYPKCLTFSVLFKTKEYIVAVKSGESIPEKRTHYCTIHNKRDRKTIETKFVNNRCNSILVKKFPKH